MCVLFLSLDYALLSRTSLFRCSCNVEILPKIMTRLYGIVRCLVGRTLWKEAKCAAHHGISTCCTTRNTVRHVCALRFYSTNLPFERSLDELEDYAERQFFFAKPPPPEEKTVTTAHLLEECQNAEAVLKLFSNMQQSNQLANEDLVLYLVATTELLRPPFRKQKLQEPSIDSLHTQLPAVLNNEIFHELLRKVVISAVYFPSHELLAVLISFAKLKIPADSNVVKATVRHAQRRINDFFPKDVVSCLQAFRMFKTKIPEMEQLEQGLILHLDNMATDEAFFMTTLENSGIHTILTLLQKFGKRVSIPTRTCLWKACLRKVKELKKRNALSSNAAIHILQALAVLKKKNNYLLYVAAKTLQSGDPSQFDVARATHYLEQLDLSFDEDPRRFLELDNEAVLS